MKELIWGYSNYLRARKNFTYRSLANHRHMLRCFLRWLTSNHFTLDQMNPSLVQDYLRFYKATHPISLRCVLHVLRSFSRFAIQDGLMTRDPTEGVSCRWVDFPGGFPAYQGILRKLLRRPAEMFKYRLPLFAPYWEAYLKGLLERGYGKRTLGRILFPNFYFHRYLIRKNIRSIDQVTPGLLKAFLLHWEAEFKKRYGRPWGAAYRLHVQRAIHRFLIFAFQQRKRRFHAIPAVRNSRALPNELLQQFLEFCRSHKGLKETTLIGWSRKLLKLRNFLDRHGIGDIKDVTVAVMDAFFLAQAKRMNSASLFGHVSVARVFFRYLHLQGQFPFDIARRLESPCRFSRDLRPKYLPWTKIENLLAGIDRSQPIEIRNYALLSLLIYHGLRPCEVANLHLSDIDWDNSSFLLRERKNSTSVKFPLAPHVKEALQQYLPTRPACSLPNLFLSQRAPFRPSTPSSFWSVARKYLRKCFGDSLDNYGPYIFRHSFAKTLLDRGAKLPEVGALLGHRRLDSTLIYTRIHTDELREAADNYANLL